MVINQPASLLGLLPPLRRTAWIALDTEADSIHCYPEKLCLMQMSYAGGEALIDPLAGLDLKPLLHVLRERELILHGADYDLRLLHRGLGFVPQTIFDTMLAARFLGLQEFGLIDLADRFLGVKLVKGPQKANWGRRPLSPDLVEYALNDARYLKPLADLFRAELAHKDRLAWHRETCDRLIRDCAQPRHRDPDLVWRLPGSERLAPPALAMLKALWHWREHEALQASKPPFFILSHDALFRLTVSAVQGEPFEDQLPTSWSERRRQGLSKAVAKALTLPASHYPQPLRHRSRRFTEAENQRMHQLKDHRDAQAKRLGLDPAFIASRSALASLVRQDADGELMQWQRDLLGQ
jgi:ribonuclease D